MKIAIIAWAALFGRARTTGWRGVWRTGWTVRGRAVWRTAPILLGMLVSTFLVLLLFLFIFFALFISFDSVNAASDWSAVFLALGELSAKSSSYIGLNSIRSLSEVFVLRTEIVLAIKVHLPPFWVCTEHPWICLIIGFVLLVWFTFSVRNVNSARTSSACTRVTTAAGLAGHSHVLLIVVGDLTLSTTMVRTWTTMSAMEASDACSVLRLLAVAIASVEAEINCIWYLYMVSDQDLLAEVVVALLAFTIIQTVVHVRIVGRLVMVLLLNWVAEILCWLVCFAAWCHTTSERRACRSILMH